MIFCPYPSQRKSALIRGLSEKYKLIAMKIVIRYKQIMSDSVYQALVRFFIFYMPLLFSLCVHEWAHAWTASLKGDNLARDQGRLSLNPLVHADLLGTCILPLMSIFMGLPVFGWAKPVPVNPSVLKKPKQDMFWIALAGPLSNFCLALAGTFLMGILVYLLPSVLYTFKGELAGQDSSVFFSASQFFSLDIFPYAHAVGNPARDLLSVYTTGVGLILQSFIYINLLLGFFNLIPLHPLDGGKVLARFLPVEWNWRMEEWEQYTSLILIVFFVTGGFRYLALPVHWLSVQLLQCAEWFAF